MVLQLTKAGSKREEEYLEAIYILLKSKGLARVKEISKLLKVRPPSVVEYLDKLSKKGLIRYEKYGAIVLTAEGMKIAESVHNRHLAIKEFLKMLLMIPDELAEEDACYIEHGIHELTLKRMIMFVEFVKNCPRHVPKFLEHLKYYYEKGEYPPECDNVESG